MGRIEALMGIRNQPRAGAVNDEAKARALLHLYVPIVRMGNRGRGIKPGIILAVGEYSK